MYSNLIFWTVLALFTTVCNALMKLCLIFIVSSLRNKEDLAMDSIDSVPCLFQIQGGNQDTCTKSPRKDKAENMWFWVAIKCTWTKYRSESSNTTKFKVHYILCVYILYLIKWRYFSVFKVHYSGFLLEWHLFFPKSWKQWSWEHTVVDYSLSRML